MIDTIGGNMELIKCPKCGNILSRKDSKCMNCGLDISTIEQSLKENELIMEGRIIDTSKKKKLTIVIIELLAIMILGILYTGLFIPKIIKVSNEAKNKDKIDNCDKYSGTWDYDNNECNYDY